MLDILARMRDVADTQNIAPIISKLLSEGYTCALVCDTQGKAFQALSINFPELLPVTTQLHTRKELYQKHPHTKVYFGSMLPDNIGRDPFSYYKKQGAHTVTIQETPGWRLTNWDTYPDHIFCMSGAEETIKARWPDFIGSIHAAGMPQYEYIKMRSKGIDTEKILRQLFIPKNTQVVSLNIPAFYAEETIKLCTEVISMSPDTTFLCSIHPKASALEHAAYQKFCSTNRNIYNCIHLSLIERCTISNITISSIVSTTLITASLCDSIPIGLTHQQAKKELTELGGYGDCLTFPYISHSHIAQAGSVQELLHLLQKPPATLPVSTQPSINLISNTIQGLL